MSTNSLLCPKAKVLRWNAWHLWVKCPYCEEIHRHGVLNPGGRISECRPRSRGQYKFIFPIDESNGLVGYEIDKRRAYFLTVSLQKGQGDEDLFSSEKDECELADLFSSTMKISATEPKSEPVLKLYKDSREGFTIPLSNGDTYVKRILLAISDCVCGDLPATSQYLDTSAEANLFLHGKDKTGNTTLIMAATEKSHEMVSLLLQKGAEVNAINDDGRSALMEAALWGRLETVKALLNSNADKRLRDHHGRCAIDLAQPAPKNENERQRRSTFAAADSVRERERDRRDIVILLGDPNAETRYAYTGPLSNSERGNYCFSKSKSEMAITFCGPIQRYDVPRITKTAAVLERGKQFVPVSATSGWGINALPPNYKTGPSWIQQVYYIASTVGHELQGAPDPGCDQGKPGQYFASHAEKKLIAYFLDKHTFMPQDKEPNETLEKSILDVEDSLKMESTRP